MNKRKRLSLYIASFVVFSANASYADLIFSRYIDGTANRKGIEIYNPDASSADLAQYRIEQYNNGNDKMTLAIALQGHLAANQRYLIARTELQAVAGDVKQTANLSFNGDDTLLLKRNNVTVDRFGQLGVRPANGWGNQPTAQANSFSRINLNALNSAVNPTASFDLNALWRAWTDRNDFNQLGDSAVDPDPTVQQVNCASNTTAIAELHSAQPNQRYSIKGVITADYRYENGFSGFYIQTDDNAAVANKNNAIFVYTPEALQIKAGTVGDEVVLNGELTEFNQQLQISSLQQDLEVCASKPDAVQAKTIALPFNAASLNSSITNSNSFDLKQYQGMKVRFDQALVVNENYEYGRYGQLVLSTERQMIPSQLFSVGPSLLDYAANNQLNKIILDDGFSSQNRTPWLPADFNANKALRVGAKLNHVEGILEYRFNSWRIQPTAQTKIEIDAKSNSRPEIATKYAGQTRVAAFNVLNYDNGGHKDLSQSRFPTERGADNREEFQRQHAKIVAAMKATDADVFGLMEIANNGYDENSAIAYLTTALGPDWQYVVPPNQSKLGTDAIAVAIIFNNKRVQPIGTTAVLDLGDRHRTTIAQSFQSTQGGEAFTVIPNHFKSKGSCPTSGSDHDQEDGQGCWNAARTAAAEQLSLWLAANPTKISQDAKALVIGDFNSYTQEQPMHVFYQQQYHNLASDAKIGQGKSSYSYVYGLASDTRGFGGSGSLDHALADKDLYPYVERAFAWHINADEAPVLDYNTEYKTAAQIDQFYAADPYRSSDHDPIIVDLALNGESEMSQSNKTGSGSSSVAAGFALLLLAYFRSRRRFNK